MVATVSVAGTIVLISSYNNLLLFADADADGISDFLDNCPTISNPTQKNSDTDTLGNECDPDDDNDKVVDAIDAFDLDASEWADFDFDKVGSNQDPDDDNDGILDTEDLIPKPISEKLTIQYLEEIEDCTLTSDGTTRLLCFGNFFSNLVKSEENNSNPLQLALALSKLGTIDDCHFISHVIGHSSFDESSNIFTSFDVDGSLCRGGYFHGVMGAYFHDLKENNESIPSSYNTICNEFIGESNYIDCVHGLGHGLVNYYPNNLQSAIGYCHQMSYFQNAVCISGAMMQYTNNELTEHGFSKKNISNMCSESDLNKLDFQLCSMNIGLSLAFHNNHELDKAKPICDLIENEDGKQFCLDGLEKEVTKAQREHVNPLSEKVKEKFQPKWIKQGDKKWIVDFRSPAVISDFNYEEKIKMMKFSFDRPDYIILHVSSDLLPEKLVIMINGLVDNDWTIGHDTLAGNTMLTIKTNDSGQVVILPS